MDVYEQDKLVKSVVFMIGQEYYFINNQAPGIKMDAKPFIEAGRTFVPVRYLSNALGVTDKHIGWESPKVTLDEPGFPVVELAVNSKQIKSDGRAKTMDVAPLLRQGRTYLPARFVAEALGYQVTWDAENSIVLCWPKGTEKPDVSKVVGYVKGQPVEQPPAEEQPVEPLVNPVGGIKELYDKAKPFEGEPFSFSNWNFHPGIQENMQFGWDLSNDLNAVIQKVSVGNLKPNGILMGGNKGIIIHDIQVDKNEITITATDLSRVLPLFYLVEEDNVVRYRGGGGYMGSETGTLTCDVKYIGRGPINSLPTPDLTKITHIMFEFAGEILLIQNPLYKGGS
ncbi:MAG: copper amine oxidase N-terminal domain-containing protein [Firmicutes bacterium]|nr:copper amine oxidase N-terminal domain-containing protein [Bacillota bacterium]